MIVSDTLSYLQDMVCYFVLLPIYGLILCPTSKIWSATMYYLKDKNPYFVLLSTFGSLILATSRIQFDISRPKLKIVQDMV